MALQSGVVQFRGKLGQTVGRRNGNKSITTTVTNNMNVLAVAPAAVSNPKTAKQASQRMKMRAAVNFYRGLRDILNHSWQGKAYKAQSRNEFMQRALNDPSLVVPFLTKGDTRFVPGSYDISSGSLAPVNVEGLEDPNMFITNLKVISDSWDTVGQLSADIINNNVGLLDGDKLVFIVVDSRVNTYGETPASQNDYYFTPVALSFVLNSQSIDPMGAVEPFNVMTVSATGHKLSFDFGAEFQTPVAAAVVHTRVPDNGATTWQRSNSKFYLANSLLEMFMDPSQFNIALASYQSVGANVNSDWYLNIGTFDSDGLSDASGADVAVTQIASLTLPAYGSIGSQSVSNVGAVSINGRTYIVISEVIGTNQSRQFTAQTGTDTLQMQDTTYQYAKERLDSAGYMTITTTQASNVYGVTVQPSEDRP